MQIQIQTSSKLYLRFLMLPEQFCCLLHFSLHNLSRDLSLNYPFEYYPRFCKKASPWNYEQVHLLGMILHVHFPICRKSTLIISSRKWPRSLTQSIAPNFHTHTHLNIPQQFAMKVRSSWDYEQVHLHSISLNVHFLTWRNPHTHHLIQQIAHAYPAESLIFQITTY